MPRLGRGVYNRKTWGLERELPKFNPEIVGSSKARINIQEFFDTYKDSKDYCVFLKNLRSRFLSQLLSDHRRNKYCMYRMIDSGQIDHYGSYTADYMKSLRPVPK